jgi:hypothetical protein
MVVIDSDSVDMSFCPYYNLSRLITFRHDVGMKAINFFPL